MAKAFRPMMFAPFLLAFASFGSLAFSLPRHQRQVGLDLRYLPSKGSARIFGWTLLSASFLAILKDPSPIAAVEWIGVASAAAASVVVTLMVHARSLPLIAVISLVAGLAALLNVL